MNEEYHCLVHSLLPEIITNYEGKTHCEEEIVAWLFTLDGCFILETLRLLSDESQWRQDGDSQCNVDPVCIRSCLLDILTDLLLLESSIPLQNGYQNHYLRGLRREKTAQKHEREDHYQYLRASATELHNNGMKFKPYEGVPSTKKLRFDEENKTLFLPVIRISDSTNLIFRNLMAVDVSQEKELTVISEYVFLMNSLIQSRKDVA
ncbi:hypothetical protein SUGI_1092380 [Cryptomeria japonica]|nr:hypothetical protein SUGI_1092380 [Cryptomeria japonica]